MPEVALALGITQEFLWYCFKFPEQNANFFQMTISLSTVTSAGTKMSQNAVFAFWSSIPA